MANASYLGANECKNVNFLLLLTSRTKSSSECPTYLPLSFIVNSLSARYQRMEIERKKIRVQKTVSQQPMIRTHSFTVPSLSEQPEVYDVTVNSEK